MMPMPMPSFSWPAVSSKMGARMASKTWHQVNGKWARSLGERGITVRLFQMTRGGVFYRTVSLSGGGQHRKSLGTRDRTEAEQRSKALLAKLRAGTATEVVTKKLALTDLWRRYSTQ